MFPKLKNFKIVPKIQSNWSFPNNNQTTFPLWISSEGSRNLPFFLLPLFFLLCSWILTPNNIAALPQLPPPSLLLERGGPTMCDSCLSTTRIRLSSLPLPAALVFPRDDRKSVIPLPGWYGAWMGDIIWKRMALLWKLSTCGATTVLGSREGQAKVKQKLRTVWVRGSRSYVVILRAVSEVFNGYWFPRPLRESGRDLLLLGFWDV